MPLHLVYLLPVVLVQHQHQVALANLILAPVYIYAIMLGEVDSSMWEQVLIDCDLNTTARSTDDLNGVGKDPPQMHRVARPTVYFMDVVFEHLRSMTRILLGTTVA
ncbi:hypothetical protein F5888DRAFT_1910530 [Russula emetica]|nr:hypothetical protein F5888DRAFT_1910530 [Russula emetica]